LSERELKREAFHAGMERLTDEVLGEDRQDKLLFGVYWDGEYVYWRPFGKLAEETFADALRTAVEDAIQQLHEATSSR